MLPTTSQNSIEKGFPGDQMLTIRLMNSRTFARPPPEPKLPPGLIELMEGLTREVLKNNPSNVYEFCTSHMQKLLEIRDGRAPKIPLTLDQKIKIAQEKVKQKAEERRRKYDEEIKSQVAQETAVITDAPEYNAVPESVSAEELKETIGTDLTVHKGLADDKEMKISFETLHKKVRQVVPLTIREPETADGEIEVFEPSENMQLIPGDDNKPIVEHIDIPSNENLVESSAIGDVGVDKADEDTGEHTQNNFSSFDAFIEEESLPDQKDLDNTASLVITQQTVEKESIPVIQYENDVLNQACDNIVMVNIKGNDELQKEINKKDEFANTTDGLLLKEGDISKNVNENNVSKSKQFFLAGENKESISISNENNLPNEMNETKSGVYISSVIQIKNEEKASDETVVPANQNGIVEKAEDSFIQEKDIKSTIIIGEPFTEPEAGDEENGGCSVESLVSNDVVIYESIDFCGVLNTSEHRNNEHVNVETPNKDSLEGEIANKFKQDFTKNNMLNKEILNVANNTKEVDGQNSNVTIMQTNIDRAGSASISHNENEAVILHDNKERFKYDDKYTLKDDNNTDEIKKIDTKVIDAFETTPKFSESNETNQTIISEPTCQMKTVSLLSVPINHNIGEGPVTHSSEDKVFINTEHDKASHIQKIDVDSSDGYESGTACGSTRTTFNTGVAGDSKLRTVDVHLVPKASNENNYQNESGDHDESTESEQMSEHNERDGFSSEINANSDTSNRSKSSDDPLATMKVIAEREDTTIENVYNFEEQSLHATSDSMDLETAAIAIQKHFRAFMHKNRCSTFEDSSNDDHTSTDEDADREQIEYQGSSSLNKERRTVCLNRMESVLQTVNEEKSLSLSTDDSSTVSSAATVIQARVRGFLTRKRLSSNAITLNSDERSMSGDLQKEKKTVLNIHIVPKTEHFISRDESILESIELSLDGSPPLSTNLHPLGYDKSEPRKQLKREDAVQSFSPPANNSDKLSEVVGALAPSTELPEQLHDGDNSATESVQDIDAGSYDTTPSRSTTIETVVDAPNYSKESDYNPPGDGESNHARSESNSLNESNLATPLDDKSSIDSDSTSKLIHSGEFHDALLPLSPTQISRDTTVVRGE